MSRTYRGRHRAPRSLTIGRVSRASAVAIASGGLLAGLAAGAQATPGPAAPATPVAPVTTPATPAPAAPATPVVSTPRTLPATPTVNRTVRWGHTGSDVRAVQRIVGTDADGIFGPLTHRAVKNFQADNGLVVDGIVGPNTKAAMGLGGSGSSSSSSSQESSQTTQASTQQASTQQAPASNSGVIGVAAQHTGIPYLWGGTTTSGFDCSGYTGYMFKQVGISLPRTAAAQQAAATPTSNPQPGDLVFFGYPAYHVGIYAGDGMMYDSGTPGTVTSKRAVFSGVSGYGKVG